MLDHLIADSLIKTKGQSSSDAPSWALSLHTNKCVSVVPADLSLAPSVTKGHLLKDSLLSYTTTLSFRTCPWETENSDETTPLRLLFSPVSRGLAF